MKKNRCLLLSRRPKDDLLPGDFSLVSRPIPILKEGELLVRNLYCGLEPAMRLWMNAESYAEPIQLDETIRCLSVCRVEQSRNDEFQKGDHLVAMAALEDYSVITGGGFTRKIDLSEGIPLSNYLSLFGPIGMTAYFGLLDIGKPKQGETVLVSGAAGAVGSLVGQIAKIKGCRTIGIAGGTRKCRRLIEEFGFDASLDYKNKELLELMAAIRKNCPDGVDIYFDNVGGIILDAALGCINPFARIVACGMISQYNQQQPAPVFSNIWQIVAKTATMRGFLGRYYLDRFPEAMADLKRWSAEGNIHAREHIEVGLEKFYTAFMRLFKGTNQGKMILQISPDTE